MVQFCGSVNTSSTNACGSCVSDFHIEDTGNDITCEPDVKFCTTFGESGTNKGLCDDCDTNYYLNDDNTLCLYKIDHCSVVDGDKKDPCKTCQANFFYDSDFEKCFQIMDYCTA